VPKPKKTSKVNSPKITAVLNDSDEYDTCSSDDEDEPWVCITCSKVFGDDGHILACERCDDKYCRMCLKLKTSEYNVIVKRDDLHWFCKPYEPEAKKSWEN
jgi:hypothetical protein